MKITKVLLIFILIIFNLHAEIDKTPIKMAVSDEDNDQGETADTGKIPEIKAQQIGLPCGIVNDCVHVISGSFSDQCTDFVVPGANPISIQRSYSSNYETDNFFDDDKSLTSGWGFNHSRGLNVTLTLNKAKDTKRLYIQSFQAGQSGLIYRSFGLSQSYFKSRKRDPLSIRLHPNAFQAGVTNCSSGEINAQTNPKNTVIQEILDPEPYVDRFFVMKAGDGTESTFVQHNGENKGVYFLDNARFANGNKLNYSYEVKGQKNAALRLTGIKACNAAEQELGVATFQHFFSDDKGVITLETSNKCKIRYVLNKLGYKYYLTEIDSPHAPKEKYTYEERPKQKHQHKSYRMKRCDRPDGRFREIVYYQSDKKKEDKREGRVYQIIEPCGNLGQPVVTYTFDYELPENSEKGGKTKVFDAKNQRTDYLYDERQRIYWTRKFRSSSLYCENKYFWCTNANTLWKDENNLTAHCFIAEGKNIFARVFTYDRYKEGEKTESHGNVVQDTIYGNLTGKGGTLTIDGNGKPTSGESYAKRSKYHPQRYHLLTEEDDGRKTICYNYLDNLDLLKSRFVKVNQSICLREFYRYDQNAVLIVKISDDGSSENENDLTGVSERHITYITPTATMPIGLPQIIEEKYLDLTSGQECLLSKTVNSYSKEGFLLQKEIYGSNGVKAYCLQREYDSRGNITKDVDALGQVTIKKYDANSNLIYEQGPRAELHKEFGYDASDRLIVAKDVYRDITLTATFQWNELNQQTSSTDIYGNTTYYSYDDCGRLIETLYPEVINEQGKLYRPVVKKHFDAMDNPIIQADGLNNCINTKFTIRHQPYEIVYPDGSKEENEYTIEGWLKKEIAKNGTYTLYTHDAFGHVIRKEVYSAKGEFLSSAAASYKGARITAETDPAGHVTLYDYDGAGRLVRVSKGTIVTEYRYDALGRVFETITGDTIKQNRYDLQNHVTEEAILDAQGTVLKKSDYRYDCDGNRTHVITYQDNGPNITETQYNAYKEPTVTIDAEGNKTRTLFHYFMKNQYGHGVACKEIIDPLGNITTTVCDSLNRIVTLQHKNAFGQVVQQQIYTYDANGQKVKRLEQVYFGTNPTKQIVTKWQYNCSQRLIGLYEAVGTPEQRFTSLTYSASGQKESITQANGIKLKYAYDALGRLSDLSSSDNTVHYSYEYDLSNHPIIVKDYVQNNVTTRTYDDNDNLIEEVLGNQLSLKYQYDAIGRIQVLTYPDKSQTRYTYNACFVKEILRLKQDEEPLKHTYNRYDLAGHLISASLIGKTRFYYANYNSRGSLQEIKTREYSEALQFDSSGNLTKRRFTDPISNSQCAYKYDALYQLTEESGPTTHTYSYDSLNNRLSKDKNVCTHNSVHQLLHDGVCKYSYDANGNLLKRESSQNTLQLTYDALNRLTSSTTNNSKITYTYDSNNRRLTKTVGGITTRYLYQGDNEIGACTADGTLTELRVLGIGLGAEIGAAVAIELDSIAYAPIHDHNGNVVALLDPKTSAVVESYRYTAFGEEQIFDANGIATSIAKNPWRFSSKRTDTETGFVYFGRRYYDPATSRWITQDPIGDAAGPNLYAFLNNSPLLHIDQYGLFGQDAKGPTQPSIWDGVVNLITKAIHFVGQCLELLGKHVVPNDLIAATGHVMQGKPITEYEMSFSRRHSYVGHVGDWDHPDRCVVTMNGILVTESEIIARAKALSSALGGERVYYIYNATHGLIDDLLECALHAMGIKTYSACVASYGLSQIIRKMDGRITDGHGRIFIETHSKSGITFRSIMNDFHVDDLKRMYLTSYASPAIINDKRLGAYSCLMSKHDGVCPLVTPFKYIQSRFGSSKYEGVVFLDSDEWPLIDHALGGDTYDSVRREVIRKWRDWGR